MKIYIIMGSTGEYEDYYTWIVCAYSDREKAMKRLLSAQSRANEIVKEFKIFNKKESKKSTAIRRKHNSSEVSDEEYVQLHYSGNSLSIREKILKSNEYDENMSISIMSSYVEYFLEETTLEE